MTWKTACIFVLCLVILPVGCSDTTTDPNGDDPHDDTGIGGLVISYESEPANAESGEVTPEGGGTVVATGSNGVEYSLEVYPHALDSTYTITVTPLSSLIISTMDSTVQDSAGCIQGALFEPSGLEFDSTAILTITYPANGLDCTLDEGFRIVSIDSASSFYEIIPTVVDLGTPSLVCTLTHFSGYGTDDVDDYNFLKYLIQETIKAGAAFPGYDIILKLVSYAKEATLNGWTDLKDMAVAGARPILEPLVAGAIAESQADPGVSTMRLLQGYFDLALWLGFTDIQTDLMNAMYAVTEAVAAKGQEQCGLENYAAGRALLRQALEWAMLGLVGNATAYAEQIEGWLSDCGEINLSVTVSNTNLRDVALAADDYSTFATFDILVTSFEGDPLEGEYVFLNLYKTTGGGGTVESGTTDADGRLKLRYAWGPNETQVAGSYRALVCCRSEIHETSLQLAKVVFTLRLNWNYSYSHTWDGGSRNVSATYAGVGTGMSSTDPGCAPMTRTFTSHHDYDTGSGMQSYDLELIDDPQVKACLFRPNSTRQYEMIDGINTPISRLVRVEVFVQAPNHGGDLIDIASGPDESYSDTTSVYDLSSYYSGTYYSGSDLYFEYDESTGFESFLHEEDSVDGYGSGTLTITLSVEEASAMKKESKYR